MKKNRHITRTVLLTAIITFFILYSYANTKEINNTQGEVTFTVKTVTDNGNYAPKHVVAIWVEDMSGFIKTSLLQGNDRKQYLYTWKESSDYNVVDAITGATLTSHQSHTVSWDCIDLDGNVVPDGIYRIWVEFTEKHAQGPLTYVEFEKGTEATSMSPVDGDHFIDMEITYTPMITDVKKNFVQNEINVFPVPNNGSFSILNNSTEIIKEIKVVSLTGSIIYQDVLNHTTSANTIDIRLDKAFKGVCILFVKTNTESHTRKILVR